MAETTVSESWVSLEKRSVFGGRERAEILLQGLAPAHEGVADLMAAAVAERRRPRVSQLQRLRCSAVEPLRVGRTGGTTAGGSCE